MAYYNVLFGILFFVTFTSCGGGGGEYYPPNVAINKIGVIKEEVSEKNINIKSKLIAYIPFEKFDQEIGDKKIISDREYHPVKEFKFMKNDYLIGIPHKNYVDIMDTNGKVLKKLDTPRYPTKTSTLELIGIQSSKAYLAIYIEQQATSHSSTLYIMNAKFDVVYKEHLLGAQWMAIEPTERGDNLIVSAETKWIPKGKWISVGGPWRYRVFK